LRFVDSILNEHTILTVYTVLLHCKEAQSTITQRLK